MHPCHLNERTCFKSAFLQPSGVILTGLMIFQNLASSFVMDSSDTNGGMFQMATFVAGAESGVTGTNVSFTHNLLSVNRLNRASAFRKTTTTLFMRKAETMLPKRPALLLL